MFLGEIFRTGIKDSGIKQETHNGIAVKCYLPVGSYVRKEIFEF